MTSKLKWIPLNGIWNFSVNQVEYRGQGDQPAQSPYGLVLSNDVLKDGEIEVDAQFSELNEDDAARILVNYNAQTGEYLSIGLGGYKRAFVVSRFVAGQGWRGVAVEGSWANLEAGRDYHLKLVVKGQKVVLFVDEIRVIDHLLEEPMTGAQVGLYVWGNQTVKFKNFKSLVQRPVGFVVMDFSGSYDALFTEVLAPVAGNMNVELHRADDIKGPGIILQDIVGDIGESTFVVAEVTPDNPNVYYELGYAHALKKPTILLVRRGEKDRLPFDIAGYRAIFYDDSIAGKRDVEREFRKHLEAILGAA